MILIGETEGVQTGNEEQEQETSMSKRINAFCTQFVHISVSRAHDEAKRTRSLRMSSDQTLSANPPGEQRVGPQLAAVYADDLISQEQLLSFQSDRYSNAFHFENWSQDEEFTESRHAM